MCPPSSSNTTQVLRRLLGQRGLEKKKAEFSDITCSRQLPGQTASGYYDSQHKEGNNTHEIFNSELRTLSRFSENLLRMC